MKSKYLSNKVVLVSGSSMGIGKAIATELGSNGAKIVLNGRDNEKLYRTETELLEKGLDVLAVAADIRKAEACKLLINAAVQKYGQLDILINNAGMSSRGAVEDMADRNFKVLAETNFMGAAHLSKYGIPHLKKVSGHIIFINTAGGFRGMPYNSAYSASKIAQAALADALRIELFDYKIHVGIAYVGFTENDPEKKILDVDGSMVYLPKRTNIKLANPKNVAISIRQMIVRRKDRITLTNLGLFANFSIRYFPRFSDWLLWINRKKIRSEFTMIGSE
ncbi:MAG: SDR family NAD(P)-dependent oxidoreductase [Eudoraea sp.]|nr:SDR family NAD(P)-dependent oxidoreductase [Eudoraea sp.]